MKIILAFVERKEWKKYEILISRGYNENLSKSRQISR